MTVARIAESTVLGVKRRSLRISNSLVLFCCISYKSADAYGVEMLGNFQMYCWYLIWE